MGDVTNIAWCDRTFNPWIGCTKVGPGCDNCYAERDFDIRKHVVKWCAGQPRHKTARSNWAGPLRWNRRAMETGVRFRVFCASLADVFDNEVEQAWREELWDMVERTPSLDWLLLTKRVGNVEKMIRPTLLRRSSVWIGATVVNQDEYDRDVPKLMALKAVGPRWLSMEPLLSPVKVSHDLDWIVVGGESGPRSRVMDAAWCEEILDQCRALRIPFFFKQGSAANWADFRNIFAAPEDLRVREFPRPTTQQETAS